jgi:hypothetical protein
VALSSLLYFQMLKKNNNPFVCNDEKLKAQSHWVRGLCQSSGKHKDSQIGCLPEFRLCWVPGVGVFVSSPEDGNTAGFRNAVFSSSLEFQTMHKALKLSDSMTRYVILQRLTPRLPTCQQCSVGFLTPNKNQIHGLSPRANYTDRATTACRRSDCQLLRIEGATWSA